MAQPAHSLPSPTQLSQNPSSTAGTRQIAVDPSPAPVLATPASVPTTAPVPTPAVVPASAPALATTFTSESDVYGQAASNVVSGSNLEATIQQIVDMGGGSWDRDKVVRALHAAYKNPERAVEYLYSGIPERAAVPPVAQALAGEQAAHPSAHAPLPTGAAQPSTHAPLPAEAAQPSTHAPLPAEAAQPSTHAPLPAAPPSGGPNANPLNLFPQGLSNVGSTASIGSLDFLRNSQQFQAFRSMVRANPRILQPMLQELGRQNPQLMRLFQEHQADFLRLMNETVEGESNSPEQQTETMPQAITVTPEEREAIERLEAMGFDRALVLQVYFACNKNEELAANYLLDHQHEFDN